MGKVAFQRREGEEGAARQGGLNDVAVDDLHVHVAAGFFDHERGLPAICQNRLRAAMAGGDDMHVVAARHAEINKRADAPVVSWPAVVQPHHAVFVELGLLERLLEGQPAGHFALVQHALLDERLADFGNVARVVDAVVVQLLDDAQRVGQVAVELAAEAVAPDFRSLRDFGSLDHEGEIARAAPDQLRFRHGG